MNWQYVSMIIQAKKKYTLQTVNTVSPLTDSQEGVLDSILKINTWRCINQCKLFTVVNSIL